MIKLITSDIDGTLVPDGGSRLPEELFPLLRRLRQAGILFCPASGRQYTAIRKLFAPAASELYYICENGAAVFGPGTEEDAPVLARSVLSPEEVEELRTVMEADPACDDILFSGVRASYVPVDEAHRETGEKLLHILRDGYRYRVFPVEGWREIPEEIIKITAYCSRDVEGMARRTREKLPERFKIAVSGPTWLDYTLADKGTGLRGLCGALGIALEETASFGDNWNDVPILEVSGQPWLMSSAAPELRARFPRQCRSVPEVLERILAEAEGRKADS